jgi:hypothetical protein
MANVYSTRFLAWAASEFVPVYVVPSGYVAVVRDADVYSFGGAMTNFKLGVNGIANFWAGQFTIIAEAQVAQWRGRQVLMPGEELLFESDEPTDGLVSGYLLGLP